MAKLYVMATNPIPFSLYLYHPSQLLHRENQSNFTHMIHSIPNMHLWQEGGFHLMELCSATLLYRPKLGNDFCLPSPPIPNRYTLAFLGCCNSPGCKKPGPGF
jgi:hypothetical protein